MKTPPSSDLLLQSKLEMRELDLELAEKENKTLRATLSYIMQWVPDCIQDSVEKKFEADLENGGVTGSEIEEERIDMIKLITALIQHVEPLMNVAVIGRNDGTIYPENWYGRLDHLLTELRQYEPKHPLMSRLGNNVYAPAKGFKK